jgi:hypothetical protein
VEFAIQGVLFAFQVQPIAGRSADGPWWLIQLSETSQGWVADQAITVQGFTGLVPIVEVSGAAVGEPGSWPPTPDPACASPTAAAATGAGAATGEPTVRPTVTSAPSATPAAGSPTPAMPQLPTLSPAGSEASATSAPATATLAVEAAGGLAGAAGSGLWVLFAGGGLLAAGVVLVAARRLGGR